METSRLAHPPPDGDHTYRKLIERVVCGEKSAWKEFVQRFSKLLFSLLWRYANGDQDRCADLYLYVIEGLHQCNESGETFYRLRRYLQSADQYGGKGRLTTWLGKVTQNLVSDFFREQQGRRTLPRNIQRLEVTSQIAFKLLHWDCLSEREAFEVIKGQMAELDRDTFDRMVTEINNNLKSCNRWSIYSEVIRKTPALPLHSGSAERPEAGFEIQVADPNPSSSPSHSIASRQQRETAAAMGRSLRHLIQQLPDDCRLLLVCRFKYGMSARRIAKLLGQRDEKRVYAELERIKTALKQEIMREGFDWDQVERGLEAIEGLMDELDPGGNKQLLKKKT